MAGGSSGGHGFNAKEKEKLRKDHARIEGKNMEMVTRIQLNRGAGKAVLTPEARREYLQNKRVEEQMEKAFKKKK